jgi:hypothetical protein
MERSIRLEILLNGVRWANNIVTEVLSNHGQVLPPGARKSLMGATRLLGEVVDEIRTVQMSEPAE